MLFYKIFWENILVIFNENKWNPLKIRSFKIRIVSMSLTLVGIELNPGKIRTRLRNEGVSVPWFVLYPGFAVKYRIF